MQVAASWFRDHLEGKVPVVILNDMAKENLDQRSDLMSDFESKLCLIEDGGKVDLLTSSLAIRTISK